MTEYRAAQKYFAEVVMEYEGDDCLIWPFSRRRDGRGQIHKDGPKLVHRLACEAVHGAPPTPLHEAAHSCGKGHLGCVTKGHLSWKTHKDNHADRRQHGTNRPGNTRLSEVEVLAISQSQKKQSALAREFGVSQSAISLIKSGKRWGLS